MIACKVRFLQHQAVQTMLTSYTQLGAEGEVEEWLRRKFEGLLKKTTRWLKEDLSMVSFVRGYSLVGAMQLTLFQLCSLITSSGTGGPIYSSRLIISPICWL